MCEFVPQFSLDISWIIREWQFSFSFDNNYDTKCRIKAKKRFKKCNQERISKGNVQIHPDGKLDVSHNDIWKKRTWKMAYRLMDVCAKWESLLGCLLLIIMCIKLLNYLWSVADTNQKKKKIRLRKNNILYLSNFVFFYHSHYLHRVNMKHRYKFAYICITNIILINTWKEMGNKTVIKQKGKFVTRVNSYDRCNDRMN